MVFKIRSVYFIEGFIWQVKVVEIEGHIKRLRLKVVNWGVCEATVVVLS